MHKDENMKGLASLASPFNNSCVYTQVIIDGNIQEYFGY